MRATFSGSVYLDCILDEASRIEFGFPYSIYAKELPRSLMYGGLRDQILV
jgi:hypothetical protein